MRIPFSLTLLFMALLQPAYANDRCDDTMTIETCFATLGVRGYGENSPNNKSLVSTENQSSESSKLAKTNTGAGTIAGSLITSALNDFNPKIQLLANSLNLSNDGDSGLQIDWNNVLNDILSRTPDEINSVGNNHKLSVARNNAWLFEPLESQLSDAQKSQLNEELGDFDDVSISFHWSLTSQSMGRKLGSHNDLINRLFNEAWTRADVATAYKTQDLVDQLIQCAASNEGFDENKIEQTPISDLLMQQIEQVVQVVPVQQYPI